MIKLNQRVIIEHIKNKGFSETEINRLEITFANKIRQANFIGARQVEFNTGDFAPHRKTSLAGLTLKVTANDEDREGLWRGHFEGKGKSLTFLATIAPYC